jgi:prophage regulatory protein
VKVIRLCQLATTSRRVGILPISRVTIWRLVRAGKFPRPIRIGGNATCWLEEDIRQYLASLKSQAVI